MNSPKKDGFHPAEFLVWLGELMLYLCKGLRVGLRWIYHNTLRHYKRRIVVLSKRAFRRIKRTLQHFWQRLTAPFHKTADGWRVVRQKMALTKGQPFRVRMNTLSDAMQDGFHTNAGLVRSLFNLCLPLLAAVVLAVVLVVVSQMNSGVNVIYNGQVIGVVNTEAQANQAIRMVQSRMVLNEGDDVFTFEPTYSIDYVDSSAIMDEYQLADEIISLSGDSIAEGEGLYVNGSFFGATDDLGTIQPVLDELLNSQRTGVEDEEVAFAESVEVVTGLYPTANLQDGEDLAAAITGTTQEDTYYTIQVGDTPSGVADALGIDYDQLLALNPGCDQPQNFIAGQQLLVTKAVPVLSVQVTRTIQYQQEIPYETETTNSSLYLQGTNKVTREGQNGLADVTARATYVNGVEVSRTVLTTTTIQEPVNEQVTVGTGTVDVSSGGSGSFIWPMSGYVSSEYGDSDGRSSNHRGMDIARYGGATGAPIYASAGGRVIYATYNSGGYGRLVKIDHGNGIQTWYAHCNTLLVSVGDVVAQGQQIATAGSTGNVTGPHLHFEVVVNGVKVNPRRYLP